MNNQTNKTETSTRTDVKEILNKIIKELPENLPKEPFKKIKVIIDYGYKEISICEPRF